MLDDIECYMFSNQQTFLREFQANNKPINSTWKILWGAKNAPKCILELGALMNSISGRNTKITHRNLICVLFFLRTNK